MCLPRRRGHTYPWPPMRMWSPVHESTSVTSSLVPNPSFVQSLGPLTICKTIHKLQSVQSQHGKLVKGEMSEAKKLIEHLQTDLRSLSNEARKKHSAVRDVNKASLRERNGLQGRLA